jgi:signal transduction histidine kinase
MGTLRVTVDRRPAVGPGSLAPQGSAEHSAVNETIAIEISDTGVGMDLEALARIFEPYFSTKAIGTGLGLTIAKRNVELNGGAIAVTSQKGVGTTVTMTFPL